MNREEWLTQGIEKLTPMFKGIAEKIGLLPPMKATTASPLLKEKLETVVNEIGQYPHFEYHNIRLIRSTPDEEKSKTFVCPCRQYQVTVKNKFSNVADPVCPLCGQTMRIKKKGEKLDQFELEDLGTTVIDNTKSATNKIKIVKELTRDELITLFKCEKDNIGVDNLGDSNTGDRNTGNRNTGDWNTGDSNTGDWNKCNNQTGYFNTISPKTVDVFNKKAPIKDWEKANKPGFIYNICPSVWMNLDDMTDDEKKEHPDAYVQNGYLKNISMKQAWKNAFEKASDEDVELLKKLPNYDYEVFKEITGIADERLK